MTVHHHAALDTGAPGVTLRLADEFRALGHEVDVLSFDNLPRRASEIQRSLMFPHVVARRLALGRHATAPDIVDASTGDAWSYLSFTRRSRRAIVVTRSHGLEHTRHQKTVEEARASGRRLSWKYPIYHGGYRLWEVRTSLLRADACLLLNEADRQFATGSWGVEPTRVHVVSNGLPSYLLGLDRPEEASHGQPLRIAVLGSYLARKGSHYVRAALRDALPQHPEWSITFLGTGASEAEVLRDYPADIQSQINVIPSYSNADLPRLLPGHQVHLFPTLFEGGPVSLLESMACGLAPVASDIPSIREVAVDRLNAVLIEPANADAIVKGLELLDADRDLLGQLRIAAHTTAQDYGWKAIAQRQIAIYRDLLARRSAR